MVVISSIANTVLAIISVGFVPPILSCKLTRIQGSLIAVGSLVIFLIALFAIKMEHARFANPDLE